MIIHDSKRMADVILRNMTPSKGGMDDKMDMDKAPEQDDNQEGLKAVARGIMDAIKADDEHAMAMALMDFIEMAEDMEHPEEEAAEAVAPEMLPQE